MRVPPTDVHQWMGRQRRSVRSLEEIAAEDQRSLRRVARETWRYFDDLVGPEHNWLPPDNSQQALRIETANRTSPTNIGMWLMSAVSALDLGYLSPEEMIERCSATMETLVKLERCEGHLLNWYNTRTLDPLQPKYVSTVDSGNLLASLWVLAQTAQELASKPQVEKCALQGLADNLAVIIERFPPDHTITVPIETLRRLLQEESSGIQIVDRIRRAAQPARKLTESLLWSISDTEERVYWITRLDQQIQTWVQYFDRYLRWADVLLAPPDEFLSRLGEHAILARQRLLRDLPSWGELAREETDILRDILGVTEGEEGISAKLAAWMTDVRAEHEKVRALSKALLARAARLNQMCEDFADGMDMRFLYDC